MKTHYKLPTNSIPVLAMRNSVIFPGQTIPVMVGRQKSIAALQAAEKDGWILTLAQKNEPKDHELNSDDLHHVGTLAKIENIKGSEEKGFSVTLAGVARFSATDFDSTIDFLRATGTVLQDVVDFDIETGKALSKNVKTVAGEILGLLPMSSEKIVHMLDAVEDLSLLTHMVSQHLDLRLGKKQELLEMISVKNRTLLLLDLLVKYREEVRLQKEIGQKITNKMGKQQRDAILREQIRILQDELGDGKNTNSDYIKKIEDSRMPQEIEQIALDQLSRLESMGNTNPESHVIRNYLDLLCQLPWQKSSPDEIDLEKARAILDADHYGLEKIKKRIVQHLAVLKLKKDKKGSILLLVGPPGVGKTSLGKSIAHSLGRKFVRASLGGVRDDAEIRGHRRTYIGAMPGRIIDAIKRSGENNPVFILDEIDKLTRGFGGDPASAMLEVLDPEQNSKFLDHYLDVPFDLSNVFFIATANSIETIPGPLLDRMEVIHLTGYTTPEKLHISKNHLLPKQLIEHGLTPAQVEIPEDVQMRLIHSYTREAGVRELQRVLAAVVRSAAEKVLAPNADLPIRVKIADLDEMLGPEKFTHDEIELNHPPGVVTGLAWTPLGGDILFIESSSMPGTGKLTLTGQLGEVMKESAQIALSLARSRLAGLATDFVYDKNDIHIHVPAGAIPKDGPSAGVTMLTTIASVIMNRKVDPKIAMTGEITLRGAVTPVGGIKEKVIAAHRAGIRKVILPKRNEKDIREVPEDVREELTFVFVDRIEEVLKEVFGVVVPEVPLRGGPHQDFEGLTHNSVPL